MKMAWQCSGFTNEELVENMWHHGLISDKRVKAAFLKVDRGNYAPSMAYEDSPQTIGHGATISAPHMHASALEHVIEYVMPSEKSPAPRVLDVGSGSGYLTHILAELVGKRGLVVGVEHIEALRSLGESNMRKSAEGRHLIDTEKVKFELGDGRRGWDEPARPGEEAQGAKWDVIHVGASAKEIHSHLLEQLKAPGCLFIPVDDDKSGFMQHIWKVTKDDQNQVTKERLFGVRYVPLTDAPR